MTKTVRIVAAALALTVALSAESKAQEGQWFWGMEYMVGLGTSDTKDFVGGGLSFRNFGIEGRYVASPNMSVSLYFGWNVFFDETTDVIRMGDLDVSGEQFRYINSFPIMATGHYYFGLPGGFRPYVGVGVGTYYVENRLDIGLSSIVIDGWHFGVAPEIGVVIPVDWHVRSFLNVRYNWMTKTNDIQPSYFTFGVGFAWM